MTGQRRGGVARVLLVAGLLAALAGAASLVQPVLAAEGVGSTAGIAVLSGAALVAVVAVVALLAVARDRRQRAVLTPGLLAWLDGLPVPSTTASRSAARAESREDRSVERVLRMQVLSLERALEGQEERLAEAIRRERRKTMLTIAALRQALDHQPGDVALNRLEAALARLGAAPDFTRPALPEGRTGAPVVFLGAPQQLAPAASVAAASTYPVEPGPVDEPVDGVAPAAPVDEPVDGVTPVDGVAQVDGVAPEVAPSRPMVRPVPAPVRPPPAGRGRRRFGRRGRS